MKKDTVEFVRALRPGERVPDPSGGARVLRVTLKGTPSPATFRAMLLAGWTRAADGPN